MKKKMAEMMGCEMCMNNGACCTSKHGLTHLIGGAGLAFLFVSYYPLMDTMMWAWILIAASVLGHVVWMMKRK